MFQMNLTNDFKQSVDKDWSGVLSSNGPCLLHITLLKIVLLRVKNYSIESKTSDLCFHLHSTFWEASS